MKISTLPKVKYALLCCIFFITQIIVSQDIVGGTYGFESSNEGWTLSGSAIRQNNSGPACFGNYALRVRGNGSNYVTSPAYNIASYSQVDISFCHIANNNTDVGEGFILQYYNGSSWATLQTYSRGTEFTTTGNSNPHNFTFSITSPAYTFPTDARFRFVSNANNNNERSWFDGILVEGYTAGPEINITGNTNSINDGDTTPDISDDTDFGNVDVASGTNVNTFTIENNGTSSLSVGTITISGANASDFTVTASPAASVATSGNTSFDITFNPSAVGLRTASVSIVNDDSNENPYNFDIQGTGTITSYSNVVVSVNWPAYANENRVEIYDPSGTLINSIGYVGTGTYSETLNLGCLLDLNNYYITMYDTFSDGWDGASPNVTITAGGSTVLTNDGSTAINTGVNILFNVSGGGGNEIEISGNGTVINDGDTTPDVADNTDFGTVDVSSGANANTFTINNLGCSDLNLTGSSPYVTVSGAHASDFTVTTIPASLISGANNTTFEITFDPSASGLRTATVSIANDDSDENPYNFNIEGTGGTPSYSSVSVTVNWPNFAYENRVEIYSPSGTLINSIGYPAPFSYSETLNLGCLQDLNNYYFIMYDTANDGWDGTDNITITGGGTTLVNQNGDTAVSGAGTTVFFNVSGGGAGNEMEITGNSNIINDGDTTPDTIDDTDFGSANITGGTNANTFTINNIGCVGLNLTGASPYVTISGAHAGDFSLTATPTASISGGNSTTFEITFDPSAAGIRTASVSIANDDSDENPYNFDIQGTGVTVTYCGSNGNSTVDEYIGRVQLGTIDNTSGAGTTSTGYSDFTGISTNLTQSINYPFTLTPFWTGTAFSEGYAIWIDYNQDGDFTDSGELVFTQSPTTATPISSNFTVPSGATVGNTRMRVSMKYNGTPTECEVFGFGEVEDYTVNIVAGTPQPEINITGNGANILNGDITPSVADDTDFGTQTVTIGLQTNTFTIQNTGSLPLNLTNAPNYVNISGANAGDFTLTAIPAGSIAAAGGSTTFDISFTPSAIGLRTAILTIANDDSDENPYVFHIQGTGFAPLPEINIQGNSTDIVDGDNTPSPIDDTNFGSTSVTGGTITNTFTIQNIGALGLTLSGPSPYVTISGANAADFAVTASPSQTIGSGSSTTFDITFDPSALGVHNATITITSNDADENPYNFAIQGTGATAPGGVNADLALWLKGTDGLGYADGDSVALWQDQGNGSNATVNTPGQEPTYRDNKNKNVNFNPVVEFDNDYTAETIDYTYSNTSTQFLEGASGLYTQDMFVVFIPDDTPINSSFGFMDVFCGDENPIANETDATGIGLGQYTARFSGETICFALGTTRNGNGYGVAETGTGNSYSNVGIINARNNTSITQQELYYNANNIETDQNDLPDFANVSDSRFWIGRSKGWEASTNGRIAEIITYSTRKDDTNLTEERNRIMSYLAIKYGITLGVNGTSQDYVNSSGDVIWDQSADSGNYNYDIAGIGTDFASGLEQKQSRSVNNANDDADGDPETNRIEGILTMGLTDIYNTNNLNKSINTTTLNDKEFLVWGNNGADLDLAATTISVNMSAGISPALNTDVTFTAMQRVWKVVETGGDIPTVKVRIPEDAIRNITPPGDFYMFISSTGVFDPTADYRIMRTDSDGNLETEYDFDGTKYITFGYAPKVVVERSVYFDGAVDYIDMEDALDLDPSGFTISAWIKRDAADSGTKSIVSKRNNPFTTGYDFRILNDNRIQTLWKNGSDQTLTSTVSIPDDEWHHVAIVYDGTRIKMYIDGVINRDVARSAPVATNDSFYIAAAGKNSPTQHFRGNIDEVRVWDTDLTVDELRFIMNQEIEENATFVGGKVLPTTITKNEVSTIPWSELAGYYPMSVYTYTNTEDASGNGNQGALRNLNTVDRQTAPLPYESQADGDWTADATWLNNSVQTIPNALSIVDGTTPIDWNIVRINDEVNVDMESVLGRERQVMGLYVENSAELTINGNNFDATAGNGLTISHYLKLDGKIDLEGQSQLIQNTGSDLDPTSAGSLEKDQQGTADVYTYNYWSSPVGETNDTTNNNSYSVTDVMYDGVNPINFSNSGYDGSDGTTITIADYWIWKFANQPDDDYSAWQHVRQSGTILAGEGYTMKGPGSGTIVDQQNYVFLGKPNNGDISLTINAGNDYLVGNPYPSAIDANRFIADNGPVLDYTDPSDDGSFPEGDPLISGTLYFWEHWGGGSHALQDYQGGYATYNYSGGVAAPSIGTNDPDVATGGTATKIPAQYIPVSQGFFVVGENTGSINFNNGQRIYRKESTGTSVFVRADNSETAASYDSQDVDDRMKFRIGINSINTIHRQLLLTIDENTTTGYDWAFDAKIYDNQMDDLFWMIDNEKYTIQGSNEAEADSTYPLGIKTSDDGINTIMIDQLENVPDTIDIYIHDKENGTYHDIRESDFEFFLPAGEYLDRFELTFSENSDALSTEEAILQTVDVFYDNNTQNIVLMNPNYVDVKSIEMFNIIGQSITKIENISELDYSEYEVKNLSTGAYIIKIDTLSGLISKKVLVK